MVRKDSRYLFSLTGSLTTEAVASDYGNTEPELIDGFRLVGSTGPVSRQRHAPSEEFFRPLMAAILMPSSPVRNDGRNDRRHALQEALVPDRLAAPVLGPHSGPR